MSAQAAGSAADRKALLATRAELDRVRVTLAVRELQEIVAPRRSAPERAQRRRTAAMLVGLAAPVLGISRLARWLRAATIALTALRILRHWRR